jgi:FkbM family methyltransferase
MSPFISKDSVMLDIGANVGAISIPLARKHPFSEFHCFEPHPDNFGDLKFNLSINKLTNVIPIQKIVCDRETESISFFAQQAGSNDNLGLSSLRPNSDLGEFKEIKMAGTSIDVYCRSLDKIISVIKIDVQGAELDVLESAKNVLSNHRPVIFFEFEEEYYQSEVEAAAAKRRLIELLSKAGYELHAIVGNERYLPKLNFNGYFHGDIVALPFS